MQIETQSIETPSAITNFSLTETVTSGQTFRWLVAPTNNQTDAPLSNPTTNTFYLPTRLNNTPLVYEVTQNGNTLNYTVYAEQDISETTNLKSYLRKRLGFDYDYETALDELHSNDNNLYTKSELNLSLVLDEPFETSISFICSPQASIDRIYQMQRNIESNYGTKINTPKGIFYTFPTPEQLESATEEKLRDLKLGYRASYVAKTVSKLTANEITLPPQETSLATDELTEELQELVGVGQKVADCISLYGYGRTEIIPVDTRIEQMTREYYDETITTPTQAKQTLTEVWSAKYAGYYQLLLYDFAADEI